MMKQPLTRISFGLLFLVILTCIANLSHSATPTPGKQVAQTIKLPTNIDVLLHPTKEELDAETKRLNALPREQRDAEIKERQRLQFEEMRNPKPLSETETQTLGYWLFLPNDYTAGTEKTYPLLLFLHGLGESGSDINKVKVHGPPKLLDNPTLANDWQFITVSPQCPENVRWSPFQLKLLLDELEKQYAIDKNRIYVTGLSLGGYGTWGLLYQFPERFAAGVPICGGFDHSAAERFVDIPLWVFHGGKDPSVSMSTNMVKAIQTAGGKRVELTIYPDLGHDVWTITYDNPELYQWLSKQSLGNRANGAKNASLAGE